MNSPLNRTTYDTFLICSKDITSLRYPASGCRECVPLVGWILGAFAQQFQVIKKTVE